MNNDLVENIRNLINLDKPQEAEDILIPQIEKHPTAELLDLLGTTHHMRLQLAAAIACHEQAIALDNKCHAAHINLFYTRQLSGIVNWKEYEHRHLFFPAAKDWVMTLGVDAIWNGKEPGQLLIYCEQGLGDVIFFSRYLKHLKNPFCLKINTTLNTLFQENGACCFGEDDDMCFDKHCSIASLPWLLGDPPVNGKPYLSSKYKVDFSAYPDVYKIGIVWAGNPRHPRDIHRSLPLKHFRGIHNVPGVKLFSLQKDNSPRAYSIHPEPISLSAGCEDMKIVDMAEFMTDFKMTAAIVSGLDLVITADTSVLHLAGALGKETWALLPYVPDWRWRFSGKMTQWYDSVRLFRQTEPGDWEGVMHNVVSELRSKIDQCGIKH